MAKKKIPVKSIGITIKSARENLGITEKELVEKIKEQEWSKKKNEKNIITVEQIKNWEKGKEFPNLDQIYKLAGALNLNPNEMLNSRNQIQEESYTEPNWHLRNIVNKFLKIGKPGLKIC